MVPMNLKIVGLACLLSVGLFHLDLLDGYDATRSQHCLVHRAKCAFAYQIATFPQEVAVLVEETLVCKDDERGIEFDWI